jgi:hypothetical protein
MFFKSSFYFIPKNTLTHIVQKQSKNIILPQNPLQVIHGSAIFSYQTENTYISNLPKCNIDYEITYFHNNHISTKLELYNPHFQINEYFYVKPHAIYDHLAKVLYSLQINKNTFCKFSFDSEYNKSKQKYNYAKFDHHRISNIISKNI